jgi:AcrR family transcriptional regulator
MAPTSACARCCTLPDTAPDNRVRARPRPIAPPPLLFAEQAGVQPPAIPRLFGDKDGLLEAVAEHVMAAFASSKAAIVEAASADNVVPLDDLRAGWQSQIAFGVANPACSPRWLLRTPALLVFLEADDEARNTCRWICR